MLIVPQKSQEINQWISSLFCLNNHLYLSLDNNVFQIETSTQKIEKTYHFDIDAVNSFSVLGDYLLLAGKRDRVALCFIISSGSFPILDPKLYVHVAGPILDVEFVSSQQDIRFGVLSHARVLHVFRLCLGLYFSNSEVSAESR